MLRCCDEAIEWARVHMLHGELATLILKHQDLVNSLGSGLRINAQTLRQETISKRIEIQAGKSLVLQDLLVAQFCRDPICKGIEAMVYCMGEKCCHEHWEALLARCPEPQYFAMTLANWRQDTPLRERGDELLRRASFWKGDCSEEIAPNAPDDEETRHLLEGCEALLSAIFARQAQKPARQDSSEQQEKLQRQLVAAQGEVTALRRERQSLQNELEQQKTRLEEERKDLRRREHEHRRELEQAREECRQEAERELERQRRELLGMRRIRWETQFQEDVSEADQLIAQAKAILQEQERNNQYHGTRAGVRRRILELEELRERMQAATAEALVLHPQANRVLMDLEIMRDDLQSHLDHEAPALARGHTMLFAFLENAIKSATEQTPSTMDGVLELAERAKGLSLLPAKDHAELAELVAGIRRRWVSSAMEKTIPAAAPQTSPVIKFTEIRNHPDLSRITMYVDAYNAMRSSTEWEHFTQASPFFDQVRRAYQKQCAANTKAFRKVVLVWDGNDPTQNLLEHEGDVDIIFAARKEEAHNADNYIVEQVSEHSGRNAEIWVVTDDQELRRRVLPHIGGIVTTATFNQIIGSPKTPLP